MKPIRALAGVIVVAVAVLVLAGVGQGKAGAQIPVSAAAQAAAKADIAALGALGTQGAAVFHSMGCDDCHTIAVSGFKGRLGPNLDGYLAGLPAAAIREFILHPLTVQIPGFTHNLMPNDFDTRLTHDDLLALLAYLRAASGSAATPAASAAPSGAATPAPGSGGTPAPTTSTPAYS